MSQISICIPTYEYKGRGVEFLAELFDSIERQTFRDFDIVISDHSKDDVIEWLVTESPFSYEVSEFETDKLSETVVLATYKINMKNSLSMRSSIWVMKDDRWQLRFHQGTACP